MKEPEAMRSSERSKRPSFSGVITAPMKNLPESELGGVIFGCTKFTMNECLSKKLFGLPYGHISYVTNIKPGLPLFLFNYSDRKMHGIYESASYGELNIDRHAWTDGNTSQTTFPAQVQILIKTHCQPLSEKLFKRAIEGNYQRGSNKFCFELDRAQTEKLMGLFQPFGYVPVTTEPPENEGRDISDSGCLINNLVDQMEHSVSCSGLPNEDLYFSINKVVEMGDTGAELFSPMGDKECRTSDHAQDRNAGIENMHTNLTTTSKFLEVELYDDETEKDEEIVLHNKKNISHPEKHVDQSVGSHVREMTSPVLNAISNEDALLKDDNFNLSEMEKIKISDFPFTNVKLLELIKKLDDRTVVLEKKQVASEQEMRQLKNVIDDSGRTIERLHGRIQELEAKLNFSLSLVNNTSTRHVDQYIGPDKLIYLVGGYDGRAWLSSLDCYSPALDKLTSLKPMNFPRSYAAAALLNGSLYVCGGGERDSWFDTVECYSPQNGSWTFCSSLSRAKGNLAGVSMDNGLFVIGGGDGKECFSDVEMFFLDRGTWFPKQPMHHKRFALAAAHLNGLLYAVGGFDTEQYLQSAEVYDPRVGLWTMLPSMNCRRGSHSLVALQEKLYAIGGHDGEKMVQSTEVFDPRLGSWMMAEPMASSRGYTAATAIDDSIYVIGGMAEDGTILDTVECYRNDIGWSITGHKAVGRRCFASAIAL